MKKLNHPEIATNSIPHLTCSPILFFYSFLLSIVKSIHNGIDYMTCILLNFLCGLCVLFEKERIFELTLFMKTYVFFFKPETVEVVLSSSNLIDKAGFYNFGHPLVGTGLITSSRKKWQYRRKLLTPTFHFRILEDFLPVFSYHSHILISRLRELEKDSWIDVVPLINYCTLDIICETAMGVKINAQTGEGKDYVEAIHEASAIIVSRVLSPWLHPHFLFRISPSGRQFYKKVDLVHSITRKVIKQKKSEMIENNKQIQKVGQIANDVTLNTKHRRAFLELLLEHHFKDPSFTEDDIREEVDTFMIAGYDSTAIAISWALYLVGLYKHVQDKIQEELDEIFKGDDEREIERNDLLRMKYLECVIKETLRLYPSAPFIAREVKENFKVLNYEVKKGTDCFIFPYRLHRDPESFPDPEKFDPERFFPENLTGRHPYAYVPFSAGPRNCLGQKYAILEQKSVLAHIFRIFEVTSRDPRDKVNVTASFLSRNLEPIMLRFTPRNRR
ncbi:cytochrome P450 4V2-like [Parasteatoda tepidariorum]|uniref:cytochrome P450 4V2-like n=1 Tax=Parasteatoda tepidariorum TaxID=114398 RepID=UPI00077FA50B|nr:cytochrome P450 4V2-like [Parasteatoda tepidariorum]